MARSTELAAEADRRRRVRSTTIKLVLFALAVYVVFIIAFVNQSR